MGNSSSDTSIKILKDAEAMKFMLDNMEAINSKFGPYDKNKFFYRFGDKSWGKLPDEARKIIMVTRAPINTNDIMAYLKDGSRGVLIAHKGDDETGELTAIHFDLADNTFAVLEDMMNRLHNDEKFQKALYADISKHYCPANWRGIYKNILYLRTVIKLMNWDRHGPYSTKISPRYQLVGKVNRTPVISKRWDLKEDDPEVDEKLQNVMSGWLERVGETEPEIRQLMEGLMD